MTTAPETHRFQAEVDQILSIVVNSLYSHREIFLRELISNASDALDKLSFRSLTDHALVEGIERRVEIVPDEAAGTLTVRDVGIGMTHDELIENLGTIAHSGTRKLAESLSGDAGKDIALIGQFGVGFYSAYLVADSVTVRTRAAGSDEAWQWQSRAQGEFTVQPCELPAPGTEVELHLKADCREYLQEWTIKSLVRKYSDYVRYPIRLQVVRTEKPEGDDQATATPKLEWETINSASALWTRARSEITDEQYDEFYKHLSHDWEPPLARTHFKVEGTQELTGLLFIPRRAPLDLFERKAHGVRLFVRRVFIMDDCDELLPEYLRFVRGVIDSEDLPLNVSRELLQENRSTRFIRKQITNRALTLLEELAEEGQTEVEKDGATETVDRYATFWQNFGRILKEGVHFDAANRERIAKLLRYPSSHGDEPTSLQGYVERMADDQAGIYYVTATSLETARHSPHIEALRARGHEVLYMVDPIDEWVVSTLTEFDGKKLIAASAESTELDDSDAAKEAREAKASELGGLIQALQSKLEAGVREVRVTGRLTDSPARLVTEAGGLSPQMERILRANGQEVPKQRRVLELNPDHAIVRRLDQLAATPDDPRFARWSELLYDQALIAEGAMPEDPARLARAIRELMQDAAES